jgi:hypothetical protein
MSNITTFANLENDLKIDYLLKNGELIEGYQQDGYMSYFFLLDDFYVSIKSNQDTDESEMKVSKNPIVLEGYLEGFSVTDLY